LFSFCKQKTEKKQDGTSLPQGKNLLETKKVEERDGVEKKNANWLMRKKLGKLRLSRKLL